MVKKLYVFDFDETLVRCDSYVYVLNASKERIRNLNSKEYHSYIASPEETLDISEFDLVIKPTIYEPVFSLLRQYKDSAVILTARVKAKPIREFLLSQNIDVPIHAIGAKGKPKNRQLVNARRKARWIYNAAIEENYEHIEFWDDYELNIEKSELIMSKLTNIVFKTHLTKH